MQTNKDVLLEQEKRLEQEFSGDDLPNHRKIELKALLYLIDTQLRSMGVRYWWERRCVA